MKASSKTYPGIKDFFDNKQLAGGGSNLGKLIPQLYLWLMTVVVPLIFSRY